jgi:hypothetical protein
MSPDEIFALIVSAVVGGVCWARWYRRAFSPGGLYGPPASRWALWLSPVACLTVLFVLLVAFAASDVRISGVYLFMYMVMGAAWLGAATLAFPALGLFPLLDVPRRRGGPASILTAAALLAVTLCFAGGNFGDGPGWWVVLFCAAMSTASLLGLWGLANLAGRGTEHVVIDRSPACAVRLGMCLVAAAAVLGRAVAGDWTTATAAVADFVALGWPAAAIMAFAAFTSILFGPRPSMPRPMVTLFGIPPGLMAIGGAVAWLVYAGWW